MLEHMLGVDRSTRNTAHIQIPSKFKRQNLNEISVYLAKDLPKDETNLQYIFQYSESAEGGIWGGEGPNVCAVVSNVHVASNTHVASNAYASRPSRVLPQQGLGGAPI